MGEDLAAVPAGHLPLEEPREELRGGVERHDAPVEAHGDDPVRERAQDVVRVALEVGQLDELPLQLVVRLLERAPPLGELHRHVIERGREPPDLVGGRSLDARGGLAPRERRGALGELLHGAGDAPRHHGGRAAAQQQRDEGGRAQLQAGLPDLGVHALLGEAHTDRAPLAALHPHRHGEVIDRLAPRRDRLLDQRLARGGGTRRHRALHRAPHALGVAAVDGHLAVGVEHERVAHVVLGGGLRDVLLERRVVVEEQRAVGDRREVPRQHLATPLELVDDRDALAMVDHDEDARHHERDHEDRAPEELRAERREPHRARSSQILRKGMYGSPRPFTSMART